MLIVWESEMKKIHQLMFLAMAANLGAAYGAPYVTIFMTTIMMFVGAKTPGE